MELWQKIPEFPEYSVSTLGRVRNNRTERVLNQSVNRGGVAYVSPTRDGKQHTRSISLLVAEAFLPEPIYETFDTPINLDGDRTNNSANNLMWRPRWFANMYARQFKQNSIGKDLKVVVVETGEELTCWEAAVKYGLLYREIVLAASTQRLDHKQVWPTFQTFNLVPQTYTTTRDNRGL